VGFFSPHFAFLSFSNSKIAGLTSDLHPFG